jgi:hypothetical protein
MSGSSAIIQAMPDQRENDHRIGKKPDIAAELRINLKLA